MTGTSSPSHYRVTPRPWIGVAVWAVYVVLVFVIGLLSGVPYTDFGKNAGSLFLGAGVFLIVGTIYFIVVTGFLGWWRPALFDRQRSKARWPIIAPILMAVALLINLASTDWGSYDGAFFAASIVLLLVGFTEEMATRGVLIVALRAKLGEGWVWFISSTLFGLMHLTNALTGQELLPTLSQVGAAFLGGTVFYILRRTTGTLIWAMVLHGLWDFSTFAVGHGHPGPFFAFGGIINYIAGALALISVAFVIRGSNERTVLTR